ncbi:histidine kinase [Winogradskyella sp.]|uniref:histidine kinase n=1 Tax=Winogradskyella sp. TaxID=1883156 RepID=UPI00260769F5|nr:histidine kinase [Winogradskyella sp.]
MRYFILCAFILMSIHQNAQNKELDSLHQRIVNTTTIDTSYVNLRLHYAGRKIYLQPDSTLLEFNKKTLAMARDLEFTLGEISALEKVANAYLFVELDPFRALDYFQEGITVIEAQDNLNHLKMPFFINIGSIYYQLQDYERALENFNIVKEAFPEDKNVYITLATTYASMKEYEKSLEYFKIAEEESRKNKNYVFLANVVCNKSFALLETGQKAESIEAIKECIDLVNTHNIEMLRLASYLNASTVYLENRDFEKAEKYADMAMELHENSGKTTIEHSLLEVIGNIYAAKEDYKNALLTYIEAVKVKDSITSADRKIEISRKEIQYRADKEKAIAEEEAKRQRLIKTVFLIIGLSVIFLSIIAFVFYKRRQDAINRAKEAEFKTKISDTELMAFRAQLNPHFITNALTSIGDFILKNNIRDASEYLAIFGHLMRDILLSSEEKLMYINKDIDILKKYLDIEKMRHQDCFSYRFDISQSIDTENTLVLPLLIQPIIENSIKYGVSNLDRPGEIIISITSKDKLLIYSIDDNGKGRDPEKQEINTSSRGLPITKSRIEIINQQKNGKGYLKIIDKAIGTKVIVAIPLIEKF